MYHEKTIHRGVQATMSKVRERFWVSKLQKLVKSVKYKFSGCKLTNAKGSPPPPPTTLPRFREDWCGFFCAFALQNQEGEN